MRQKVYREIATGDFYVCRIGGMNMVDTHGEGVEVLSVPQSLFRQSDDAQITNAGQYTRLEKSFAANLAISSQEFKEKFREETGLYALCNTPIAALMSGYEEECCDFSDIPWVVSCTRIVVANMEDSQARCFMHTLMENAAKSFPPLSELIEIDAHGDVRVRGCGALLYDIMAAMNDKQSDSSKVLKQFPGLTRQTLSLLLYHHSPLS